MLGIAFNTMAKHRTNIEKKIGCHSKAGITAYAYQNNLM
jgi:DNA-binding CsgD family transcriptional regulator